MYISSRHVQASIWSTVKANVVGIEASQGGGGGGLEFFDPIDVYDKKWGVVMLA
jgi:hypothetical protein